MKRSAGIAVTFTLYINLLEIVYLGLVILSPEKIGAGGRIKKDVMNAVPGLYPQSYATSSVISMDTHSVLLRKGAKLAHSEAPPAHSSLLACSSQGFRREIYTSESSLFLPLLCVCGFLNISHLYLILSYCRPLEHASRPFTPLLFQGVGSLGWVLSAGSLCAGEGEAGNTKHSDKSL